MAKTEKRDNREVEYQEFALRKPELMVLTDHALKPEHTYRDSFNLRYRLGPVFDIVRYPDTQTPMAIAVYGDWGTGKTTAMKWLHGLIDEWNKNGQADEKIKIRPVWFYPWKYDKKKDVWRGLISEVIINSIDIKGATKQIIKNAAKQFGLFLGRSFLHVLAGVKLKVKDPSDSAGAEIDLASINEILAEYKEAAHPEQAFLNEFENSLETWINNTLGKDERMVIFIDDLDRCMPEIALQVLEALKLYLNIEKLIFVVGVDKKVVDKLVKEHYKKLGLDEDKSKNYLAKMFQVEVQVEPSEQQISEFLDEQLQEITYWKKPHLSEDERKLFRSLIFKMAERNPREVKRLINSALMMGAGAMMLKAGGLKFNQGLQLFFIRRILEQRYTMGLLVGSNRGNDFFRQWSENVCQGRERDENFPCNIKDPEGYFKQLTDTLKDKSEESLEEVSDKMLKRTQLEKPSFAPPEYHEFLKNPRFSRLLHLLGDEDLGQLMRIPYPVETAEIAALVGTSKDEDIILEAIARHSDKKLGDVTSDDYNEIEVLNLSDTEISDLEQIKQITNLKLLKLNNTQVSDIEPIRHLTNLQGIDLNHTQVSNLEPIKGLKNLKYLYLRHTSVNNLEPIKGLTKLERLLLSHTQVRNLEPIKGLTNLQELDLYNTKVSNLKPIKELTKLERLLLSHTQVRNLEPIKGLTNLQELDLIRTQVNDLEPIKGFTNLQGLRLKDTQVNDLESIKELTSLKGLDLRNTQVNNLEPIKGLTSLIALYLGSTQVNDLEPLKHLTLLKVLDLKDTEVSDEQAASLKKTLPKLNTER